MRKKILAKRLITFMLALTMVLSNTMVAYAAPEGEPESTNTVIDETEEPEVETTEEESSEEETSVEDTSEEENSESKTEEKTSEVADKLNTDSKSGLESEKKERESAPTVSMDSDLLISDSKTVSQASSDTPDNDELLFDYLEIQLKEQMEENGIDVEPEITPPSDISGSNRALMSVVPRSQGMNLTGFNKQIYDYLKSEIADIAAGNTDKTTMEFVFPISFFYDDYSYTADDLGVESITVDNGEGTNTRVMRTETKKALEALIPKVDFDKVMKALLADCPYELYWYDKTQGYTRSQSFGWEYAPFDSALNDFSPVSFKEESNYTISLTVAKPYSATNAIGTEEIDLDKIRAVNDTVTNAQGVVEEADSACNSDYEKLEYYRDWLCDEIVYNDDAAEDGYVAIHGYGDPWQVVYAFDRDSDTNVVCEGYSKAFKWLCDLTAFEDDLIGCHLITGDLYWMDDEGQKGGGHMWNIVRMDDDVYYMVDVTNYDSGDGNRPFLFLGGYSNRTMVESQDSLGNTFYQPQYTYGSGIDMLYYFYDSSTRAMYSEAELAMSATAYVPTSPTMYTVSFNANGHGTAPTAQEVRDGGKVTAPTALTATGLYFTGWYTEAACENRWDFDTDRVTDDLTLYAGWRDSKYVVTLNDQFGHTTTQEVEPGGKVTEPADPSKPGYVFLFWTSDSAGHVHWDFDEDVVNDDMTLYGWWHIVVTYNSMGGSSVASAEVNKNSLLTKPADPTKEHYSFAGWYKDATCNTPWDFANDKVTSAITLYAKWAHDVYTVTFDSNGGCLADPQQVNYGDTVNEPISMYRSGYRFGGWYTDAELKQEYDFDTEVTGSFTLYAKWTANPEVSWELYNPDDGQIYIATSSDYINVDQIMYSDVLFYDETNFVLTSGRYVVDSEIEWTNRVTIDGDVELVLTEDGSLTADEGICVPTGSKLTIYGDENYIGSITATGVGGAGIGGNDGEAGGLIEIHSGHIEATGGAGSAGIGGGKGSYANVYIYGGEVTATGGSSSDGGGAGIGTGCGSSVCNAIANIVMINPCADCTGANGAAGIGGGQNSCDCNITIHPEGSVGAIGTPAVGCPGTATANLDLAGMSVVNDGHTAVIPESQWQNTFPDGQVFIMSKTMIYTVTFDNQGHGVAPATQDVIGIGKINNPGDLSATGYTFGGWYKEAACKNAWNFNNNIMEDTTLYAKWTPIKYTITYDSKGGSAVASVEADYDSRLTAPSPAPTRTGYTFGGWYKESGCVNEWIFNSDQVKGSATLFAKWIALPYTVTFDSQGGSVVAPVVVDYDSTFASPGAPTRTGYTFGGWYKESACENEWNFASDKVLSATTLYAKWTPIKYTITYDSKGGSAVASVEADYDSKIASPAAPTRTGYTFGGWYKETACENAWNFESDNIAGAMTLYAKWTPIECTITFDSNGGSEVASITADYDSLLTKPEDPTKTESTFAGWFEDEDCSNPWIFESETVAGDMTLYAKWTTNQYTVTFATYDGSDIDAQLIDYNEPVVKPADPDKPGCIFDGWYKNATYSAVWDFDNDKVSGNITLHAKWLKVITADIASMTDGEAPLEAGRKLSLDTEIHGADIYYMTSGDIETKIAADILATDAEGVMKYDDVIELSDTIAQDAAGKKKITVSAVVTERTGEGVKALCVPIELTYYIVDEANDWGELDSAENASVKTYLENSGKTPDMIPDNLWIYGVEDKPYTGSAITMDDLKVFYGKKELKAGSDYTVKYSNNTKAGTATVKVTGKGNIAGSVARSFKIEPMDIAAANAADIYVTYNGKVQKGTTTVTYVLNGKTVTLKAGTDFTYSYPGTNTKEAGYDKTAFVGIKNKADTSEDGHGNKLGYVDYTVTITGKGNYSGTGTFKQRIFAKDDDSCINVGKFSISAIPAQTLTDTDGNPIEKVCPKPTVKVTKKIEGTNTTIVLEEGADKDYTLSYLNNNAVGTATVVITGNEAKGYCGTRQLTFKINGLPMSKVTVTGIVANHGFTGDPVGQEGVVLDYKASKNAVAVRLQKDRDYTVTYTNNVNVGKNKATVIFTGKGAYSGTLKKTYNITATPLTTKNEANKTVEAGDLTVEMKGSPVTKNADGAQSSYPEYAYTKGGVKPEVVVKYDGKTLNAGTDYTIKYTNNNAKNGRTETGWTNSKIPTITITAKGNYTGSITRQFCITGSGVDNIKMSAGDIVYSRKANICKPAITLYDSNGTKLVAGTDYEKAIKYYYVHRTHIERYENRQYVGYDVSANTEVGNKDIIPADTLVRAVVACKGNYAKAGEDNQISAEFRFVSGNISKASVKIADQIYSGKAIELSKKDFTTIKYGKVVLGNDDYEIVPGSYVNNINKGTAKVIIRGKGGYGGTKTVTFRIVNKSMNFIINYDNNKAGMDSLLGTDNVFKGKVAKTTTAPGGKLAANKYTLVNYTFAGWNTRPDGTGTTYASAGKFTPDDEILALGYGSELTLYANWTATPYKLTYKLNGGIAMDAYPATYTVASEAISFKTPDNDAGLAGPVREGYVFGGWYLDSRCTSKPIDSIETGSTGNKTLYAKWVIKQTTWDKVVCIGDSLTEPNLSNGKDYSYPAYMQSMLQARSRDKKVEVTNLGVGGATVYERPGSPDPTLDLGDSLDASYRSEVDAVFYMAGVCDWFLGGEVINGDNRTIDPKAYLTGYTAALESQFTDLAELYPNATIYVIPTFDPAEPLGLAGGLAEYVKDGAHPYADPYTYLDALRNVQVTKATGRPGFVVIDTISSGVFDGKDSSVKSRYFKDSVHLNSSGYKLLATILAQYGLQ